MHCDVFKFSKKTGVYVYVLTPEQSEDELKDVLDVVPQPIRNTLGLASFVMHLNLAERERLAQADIEEVRQKLGEQGYFIQWPPGEREARAS